MYEHERHTWRVTALSTMCATTVDVLILPGGKHWTWPFGTSHQDESDDELDAHQDEDRTDPERTEEEGDIWCYISCS